MVLLASPNTIAERPDNMTEEFVALAGRFRFQPDADLVVVDANSTATPRAGETRFSTAWQPLDAFSVTISRVCDLWSDTDEEETPTTSVFAHALSLLFDTRDIVSGQFPRGSASTTVDRGIQVYWRLADRYLKLSVPHSEDQRSYIYSERGDGHGFEPEATPRALAKWIRWLKAR
jgi:hypothetical protein